MSFENESFDGEEPTKAGGRTADDTLRKLASDPLEQARAFNKYVKNSAARLDRLRNLLSVEAAEVVAKYPRA
jgi:hypothetical protein